MPTIDQFPAATLPLTGTEVIGISQNLLARKLLLNALPYVPPFAGAVTTSIFVKLAQTVSVLDFGADPTGATDSTAAIQAAINAVAAQGGGNVFVPFGLYKIGTAGTGLVITTSNVRLVGAGANFILRSGFTTTNPATQFIWGGASSLTAVMLAVATPASATNFSQSGNGASGIEFNCNSLCGYGVQLTSQKSGRYDNLYVINPISAAYQTTTLLNSALPNDSTDTQHNIFTQCHYRCLDSAAAKKAHGYQFTSVNPVTQPGNGNSSFNYLIDCVGLGDGTTVNSSGVGFKFDAADNNNLTNCVSYRTGGTTVPGLQLNGFNSSCDGNVFIHFSDSAAANAINILGNATLGSGFNPTQNSFFMVDSNNNVAYPTLDTGCRVFWNNTNGSTFKPILLSTVMGFASNENAALGEVANVTSESVRIRNGSQNHMILTDGTTVWGINIDGSANLRFSNIAGTGSPTCVEPFVSGAVGLSAGGGAQASIRVSTVSGLGLYFGTGAPTLSAAEGSIYSNTTGSAGARLYVNTSAGSGTTWTALTTP
jgi:hypothetical protein